MGVQPLPSDLLTHSFLRLPERVNLSDTLCHVRIAHINFCWQSFKLSRFEYYSSTLADFVRISVIQQLGFFEWKNSNVPLLSRNRYTRYRQVLIVLGVASVQELL
jgi:hypothetical protein